jgi:flavin-dependent dehydrogenase
VTGALIRAHNGHGEQVLAADLVTDATGRGSRTPVFLEAVGYGRPVEDTVQVRVCYSSQLLRLPPGTLKEKMVIVGPVPGRPTGMALFGYENDMWIFTVLGMAGVEPPCELAEMLSFADGLAPAHILAAIGTGEPLAEVCRFRYPESRWRRYDKMRRFPDGLVVLGDAICSFNPAYGQGMTVAALQAQALGDCLREGTTDLARRYFRAAAKPIGVAWQFAVGADLSVPEVEGRRPMGLRLSNRFVDRLQIAAETDIAVAEQFIRVVGLLDPPATLLHPKMLLRAARVRRPRQTEEQPSLARR